MSSALATVVAVSPAAAQSPASPPTREQVERPVAPPTADPRMRLEIEGDIPRGPCALDRPDFESIRFTVSGAEFENLRGIDAEALRPAYAPYVGTEQPLAVICEIRDRASAILREAGYLAAIEVPEQRIEGGQIRFRVLMARLTAIRVRGDAGRNERIIAAYLERLTGQDVFNRNDAERYLLLAGDLPGYTVRLALRPAGTEPGDVVGDVTVIRIPGQVDLNLQNFGSRATGRGGALLRGQVYGLTGMGDRTSLAFYTTADLEEQQTLQFAHDFRVGSEGLQFGGQVTYAWAEPWVGDPAIDIDSRTLFATIEAHYPFVRRQHYGLRGTVGLDIVDQEVTFNGIPLSEDRLRVLFARLAFDATARQRLRIGDPAWRLAGAIEIRQGFRGLGASEGCDATFTNCTAPGLVPPSRFEGDPAATVLRANMAAEVRPVPNVTVFVGASSQYSDSPLMSFEEFSVGNYTVGRGYDPATLTGDRGFGVQAEMRFGRLVPRHAADIAVQPYLFFDAAWVRNEDRFFVAAGAEDLQSAGVGLRAIYGDAIQIDASLAVPLARVGFFNERPDPRLLVTISTRLWPGSLR